jgi:hypothetical protein
MSGMRKESGFSATAGRAFEGRVSVVFGGIVEVGVLGRGDVLATGFLDLQAANKSMLIKKR